MQLCVLALAAALVGMICVPTSFSQNRSSQQQQQINRVLKAQQQAQKRRKDARNRWI